MPGRDDFAIIRARLLADDRAHRAAELYVEAGIAVAATALATVVGHVAEIGLWASRETDDGVLPGDGVTAVAVATMSARTVAQTAVTALMQCDLLRAQDGGVYVAGFADCYWPMIQKRRSDAERKAQERAQKRDGESARRPTDVRRTSKGRRRDSDGRPCDTDGRPNAPNPSPNPIPDPSQPSPVGEGGGLSASPAEHSADAEQPLSSGERAAAAVVAEAIERGDVRLEPDDEQRGVERDLVGADAAKRDASRARDGNALAAAERKIEELNQRRREMVERRRADAAALLRSGAADARALLERWQASDVLVGHKDHRVPLRVACNAARSAARADARDLRRDARDRGDAS